LQRKFNNLVFPEITYYTTAGCQLRSVLHFLQSAFFDKFHNWKKWHRLSGCKTMSNEAYSWRQKV